MSIARSTQPLNRAAAAAFDFDVVTDTPPPRPRPPVAQPAETAGEAPPRPDPAEAKG